jgi:hypothetical protein
MDDDSPRDVGQLRHLSESVLYAFVREQLTAAAAAEVANHLELCLACRVWANRLRHASVNEPDEPAISRLVAASPAVPQALRRAIAADTTDAAPAVGELWRVGRDEALLVWVRRVFDDSAAVLPVTFDGELADEHSLIIPDSQSPLGLELVVMASIEAEIDLRAFLQRITALPVEQEVATLRQARRSGHAIPPHLPTGVPIISDQDQRVEYRQVVADLLADLSTDAFAAEGEVQPTDDGLDVQQFIEDLRGLAWHRDDVTIHDVPIEHVRIDTTHELLLLAWVEHLDVAVPVAVLTGMDPAGTLTRPELAAACGPLLSQRTDATAVAVAIPDDEWTAVVVDRAYASQALEAPSGRLSPPRVAVQPLALVDALLKYFDGHATRWDGTEAVSFTRGSLEIAGLGSAMADRAIERVTADGRRAHTAAKKAAYTSLGAQEATLISELIESITASGVSPSVAVEQLLGEGPR